MDFALIDELRDELKTLRPLNDGELSRIREEFMIDSTYNSNAIEGNALTLLETALVIKEGITIGEKPLKDHLEAIGHRDAFEYIVSLADAASPLTELVIKEIHSLVLINDPLYKGTYRNVPVRIMGAQHNPPKPLLIQEKMEELLLDYSAMKRTMHPIEAAAEFHLRFEGIHPFIDGNGRTGRLLMNFELIKAGLLPVNIKYADRMSYYNCFDSYYAHDHSNTALAQMIAKYETEELESYIQMLKYE